MSTHSIALLKDHGQFDQPTTIIVLPKDVKEAAASMDPWLQHPLARIVDEKINTFTTLTADGRGLIVLWRPRYEEMRRLAPETLDFVMEHKENWTDDLVVDLTMIYEDEKAEQLTLAISRALGLSGYDIAHHKADKKKPASKSIRLAIHSAFDDVVYAAAERGLDLARVMKDAMTLVDLPANHKTTHHMDKHFRMMGEKFGFDVRVMEKPELETLGFHGLLAVNRGSEDPAKCLVGSYGVEHKDAPLLLLVGKGVTFDTGGVSLKPGDNMHYMKSDMGGAAAVMGAIAYAASLRLPIRLQVLVPTTDNSIGTEAIKPGDVIGSYKGSTIEVIHTDAEGRLILADGLSYGIDTFKPDYVIDVATLTGSVIRALGNQVAGFMSNDDDMAGQLESASKISGEAIWRLPHYDDYDDMMKSDVADIKNLSAKPVAGSITAGKFLQHFTNNHPRWAHIDIAGTSFGTTPYAKGYSSTGYGIHLLTTFMRSITL